MKKNKLLGWGLIALVAVIAMTVVGCDLFGNKDDGGGSTSKYVPITQIPDNYLNTKWSASFGSLMFFIDFGSDAGKFVYTPYYPRDKDEFTITVTKLTDKDYESGPTNFDMGLSDNAGRYKAIYFKTDGSKLSGLGISSWEKY
jgi:hypothetical protein